MASKEITEKIALHPEREKFDAYTFNLQLPLLNFKKDFKGVLSIYEFCERQIEGFSKYEKLPTEFNRIKGIFINIKTEIIQLLEKSSLYFHDLSNALEQLKRNDAKIFLYDSPETKFLIETFLTKSTYYEGAYKYLTGGVFSSQTKDQFAGAIMAYEFESKKFSEIVGRKNAEKKSISEIRNDFEELFKNSQQNLESYLANSNQAFQEYAEKIDTLKTDKENLFTNWYSQSKESFKIFHEEAQAKIIKLESLYEEKLKLEAPAQYWNKRASTLKAEGQKWLIWLSVCIIIGVVVLIAVLNLTANGTLKDLFKEVGTAVKWSVVLITLISFLAFGIRTFAKLMFSAFHLSRDAEEREQLTYVYLSLQKDKAIDSTERHMIMQSLFSRADSGLLKDDSGPTMPSNIVDQIGKGAR